MNQGNELNELIIEYMKLHPNSRNPMQYLYVIGIGQLIELLKNANGREIVYKYENPIDVLDGGFVQYIQN